jgi:hypothetical protein
MSFDSLTFARRLKAAGFSESQAEALADASREMVIHDLATKDDLVALKSELNTAIAALEERLTLRLTVCMGIALAGGLSLTTVIIGALIKFH